MKNIIITVGGVTHAIKLRKLLIRDGVESELIKISDKDTDGCTHGLRINNNDLFRVVGIMREKGIEYSITEER